jgi:hypothetical protein
MRSRNEIRSFGKLAAINTACIRAERFLPIPSYNSAVPTALLAPTGANCYNKNTL